MRTEQVDDGFILYQKDTEDMLREAVQLLARHQAEQLDDEVAAQVGILFPQWAAGEAYRAGERLADAEGRLYRVVQAHVSQADWPITATPALYTPLGVHADNPEQTPQWRQPLGAEDAYQTGDKVMHHDVCYESTVDANTWEPGVYGWSEVAQ